MEQVTSHLTAKLKSPPLEKLFLSLPHPKVEMLCSPPMENTSASTGPGTPVATLEKPGQVSMDAPSVEDPVTELVPANPALDPQIVVTPLSPDCTDKILCKYGIYEDWKHIITGLWEGFDVGVRETPPCSYIFCQLCFITFRP